MNESVDGVHITEDANRLMAEAVWETMLPNLPRSVKRPRKAMEEEEERRRRHKRQRSDNNAERSINEKKVLVFFQQVKDRFEHEAQVYAQFIRFMASLKNKAAAKKTVASIGKLFKVAGHPDLIRGLNAILPEDLHTSAD